MRLDSHQHFWRYNETDYIWMSEKMGALRQDFLPEMLESHLRFLGFDGTIAVQARRAAVETEWLLSLTDQYSFIKGVVGWVDFDSHQLDEQLERFASHSQLKGVRELIHDMPDATYATSSIHTSAISKLANFGLTYDLLLKPPHIRPAIALVKQFPNQPFVVDHVAKPPIDLAAASQWENDLRELARCDNVYCKLSGMVTETSWHAWKARDFYHFLDVALEAFSPNRLMIGSDWPVCTLSGSYEAVMRVVMDYVSTLSLDEYDAILGETCARFYGIRDKEEGKVSSALAGDGQ